MNNNIHGDGRHAPPYRQGAAGDRPMRPLPGRPPSRTYLTSALLCAASVVALPELGLISFPVMCALLLYLVSARGPFWSYLLPLLASAGLFARFGFRAEPLTLGVMFVVISALLASAAAGGVILHRDGDFHKSLVVFIAVGGVLAYMLGMAVAIEYRISPEALVEKGTAFLNSALDRLVAQNGAAVSAEEVALIRGEASLLVRTVFAYAPAVVGAIIGLCGVISLRGAGFIHNLTNTAYYHPQRRTASVDVPFAVLFCAAALVSLVGGSGVVAYVAGNVLLILTVPAVAAGVSVFGRKMARRRAEGRGNGIFLLLLLAAVFYMPSLLLYVPAFAGCIDAFVKLKKKSKSDKR